MLPSARPRVLAPACDVIALELDENRATWEATTGRYVLVGREGAPTGHREAYACGPEVKGGGAETRTATVETGGLLEATRMPVPVVGPAITPDPVPIAPPSPDLDTVVLDASHECRTCISLLPSSPATPRSNSDFEELVPSV